MKKSKWLDCQGNEFFQKQKGTPSLVKIEHKNTATLDSARSEKNSKVAVLQLYIDKLEKSKQNGSMQCATRHTKIRLNDRQFF